LGFAEKSAFVGPFADAMFSMKPGDVHAPVKTQFGWHIIRLEEIQAAKGRGFDEVRAELAPEYQKSEAERRFSESQEKLEQLAFEQSGSLDPIVKALGLKIEDVSGFHADLAGNELAANKKAVAAAFSADVLGGQNSKAIELVPGNVVVLRASDHQLPAQQGFEAVRDEVAKAVRHDVALADAKAAAARVAAAVADGTAFDAALKPVGPVATPVAGKPAPAETIRLEKARFIARQERDVAPELVAAVFQAARPADGKRSAAIVPLKTGDVAVYLLTAVKPGEFKGDGESERREFRSIAGQEEFVAYLGALRAKADIHSNPAIFE
jgi:peptidyl-prolyl cis-trans isomerase D